MNWSHPDKKKVDSKVVVALLKAAHQLVELEVKSIEFERKMSRNR